MLRRADTQVAFTGSVATGRKISIAAASSNLKKVTLELGGKSPLIVFDSADVKQAANWTAMGVFYNTGQDCTASSRVSYGTVRQLTLRSTYRKASSTPTSQS